jgi:hypothetical protein
MDATGRLIAVGSIVKSKGGSISGARRAAARALAQFGVGIKVSADGEMSIFLPDKRPNPQRPSGENLFIRYG